MRDLRFRALFKHLKSKETIWLETMPNHALKDMDGYVQLTPWMQFTGLTDKNGKEIYEGGLVKSNGDERVYKIKYSDKYASFVLVCNEVIVVYNINASILEIIGNIHEHGHLL